MFWPGQVHECSNLHLGQGRQVLGEAVEGSDSIRVLAVPEEELPVMQHDHEERVRTNEFEDMPTGQIRVAVWSKPAARVREENRPAELETVSAQHLLLKQVGRPPPGRDSPQGIP